MAMAPTHPSRRRLRGVGIGIVVVLALVAALVALRLGQTRAEAAPGLTQLSSDTYTNASSQHATEVEPDTFAAGSTIVSAFQTGRFYDGGASNIGWATSTNGGATWTHGMLPGITVYAGGPWDRVSDPTVAYDLGHHTWLISGLVIAGTTGAGVVVSRSTDGGLTWSNPVTVALAPNTAFFDKEWVVCDSRDQMYSPPIMLAQRQYAGYCYVEWDDANAGVVYMSVSHDGGATWSAPNSPATNDFGIGGQPLIQPNGTVIVPIWLTTPGGQNLIGAYRSTNGGATWSAPVTVASLTYANDPGNIRGGSLPSAQIDGAGAVYIVWADCRFEPGCSANDIVLSSSADGVTWSTVSRIPMDAVGSGADHLLSGIAVNAATSGAAAQLGVVYYYFPTNNCAISACQLKVGYVSSANGGATWSAVTTLAGPMTMTWLASTNQGYMVGDYMAAAFSGGKVYPVFMVASAPSGGVYNEAAYTVAAGLTANGGSRTSAGAHVYGAPSGGGSVTPHGRRHRTAF